MVRRLLSSASGATDTATVTNTAPSSALGGLDTPLPSSVPRPSREQLYMMFVASALPFVGFGFLDNFLMILFGELIDNTFCVMFNFSTMAAAAIGNTISDVAAIFSGGAVENLARRMGIEEPELEYEQKNMAVTKNWQYAGRSIGIVVGCTLGCCPLLWMDPHEGERLKRAKERDAIFESVITKVGKLLGAEAVSLMRVDKETGDLVSTHESPNLPRGFRWKIGVGFIGQVAASGKFVNIADVKDEPLYDVAIHENLLGTGIKVHSILCMPLYIESEVMGVVLLVNKISGGVHFSQKEEDILSAICSHISIAMADSKHTFDEVIEVCERSMSTPGSAEWSTSAASQRMKTLYHPALEGIRKVLGAEATALMLLDHSAQELYTEVIDGPLPPHRTLVGEGVAGQAVQAGATMNVDVRDRSWYDEARYHNYQGSNIDVRSELVVPLFDTSRKCLGAIKCLNKHDKPAFGKEDVDFVTEAALHIGMMLEGPDAGLRRVLALSRKRMQSKEVMEGTELGEGAVICHLERAQSLPSRRDDEGNRSHRAKTIDPYVTFNITRGDPMVDQGLDLPENVLRARNKDRQAAIRRFAKSNTVLQDSNPRWAETIAVAKPGKLQGVAAEELYLHVLLWDYDALKTDELVAQASIPLHDMPRITTKARPFKLHPVPGQEALYNLEQARLWVSFNINTNNTDEIVGSLETVESAAADNVESEQAKDNSDLRH